MRILKTILLVLLVVCATGKGYAQMIGDPTTWTYEVKKKGGGKYDLIFHLVLKDKWHIWSLKPGGDGMQIPPSFKITADPAVQLVGKIKEVGKPQTVTMEGVDGKVTLFAGNVEYIQSVVVKGKTKITGTHDYQVCNDKMCLPPKTKNFEFNIQLDSAL